jgi:tetratricopeptide (TPR) repeat protein
MAFKDAATPIYVWMDYIDLYVDDLTQILNPASGIDNIKIISSARLSDWRSKINRKIGALVDTEKLDRISQADTAPLIAKIDLHVPNPAFTKLTPAEKRASFSKSDKQLLIAMREAAGGQQFDNIIEDEFKKIDSREARLLFLVIAISTKARVGIASPMIHQIFNSIRSELTFDEAFSHLGGMADIGRQKRYVARHENYVSHIIDRVADLTEIETAIDCILTYFSGFQYPIIRHLGSKLDQQLFKYVINHKNIQRIYANRGQFQRAKDIYERVEVALQLDGHYWLQRGLLEAKIGKADNALRFFRNSVEAYEDNPFAKHALAHYQLVWANKERARTERTDAIVAEAVAELLKLHARGAGTADKYRVLDGLSGCVQGC